MNPTSEFIVRAPYDLRQIAVLNHHDAPDVERFLSEAWELHRKRQPLPKHKRAAILQKAASLLRQRQEAFAMGIAQEGGKPLQDARVEAARAAEGLENAAHVILTEAGEEIPMGISPRTAGRLAYTRYEPLGPVVAISAFNHPLNLIVHQAAPAVAAGCPVIVKPALNTPLSCMALIDLLHEAGLPEAWARVALAPHDLAEKLATDERVAFFSFIGSKDIGWMLRSKLAPGTHCALEHGGSAPVVMEADADVADAVPLLCKGGFYHAGQVCVSVQRIFVHKSRIAELSESLTKATLELNTGDPEKEETQCGPLIRPTEVDRVHRWVTEAREQGATLLCGGNALSETTYAPTLLLDPPDKALVSCDEVFGPVVCLYPYDNWEEAVDRANAVPYAFQASVFTQSIDKAHRITEALDAATVMVNDHTAFRADWMPFEGRRQSGHGTGGIPHSFADMRARKLVVTRFR